MKVTNLHKNLGFLVSAAGICAIAGCRSGGGGEGVAIATPSPGEMEAGGVSKQDVLMEQQRLVDRGEFVGARVPQGDSVERPRAGRVGGRSGESLTTVPGLVGGFDSIDETNLGTGDNYAYAPDVNIAVSDTHVVVVANSAIGFYSKADPADDPEVMPFGTSGGFYADDVPDNLPFDPKCVYDWGEDRFYVITTEAEGVVYTSPTWYSKLRVSVSVSGDPGDGWIHHEIDTSQIDQSNSALNTLIDQPGIGFNDDNIYISGTAAGQAAKGYLAAIDKDDAFDGTTALEPEHFTVSRPLHLQPMIPAPSESTTQCLFAGMRAFFGLDGFDDDLYFLSIRDPFTASPSLLISAPIDTGTVLYPTGGYNAEVFNPAISAGSQELRTYGHRVTNLFVRGDSVSIANSAVTPTSGTDNVVGWYAFDHNDWPATAAEPTLSASGVISGSGEHYTFPAIATDEYDNAAVVMAHSSASDYASIQVSVMPSGGAMSTPKLIKIGDSGPSSDPKVTTARWGDYFDIVVDPSDETKFWIGGAYENNYDWTLYVDSFKLACSEADLVSDGILNFFDVSKFIEYFNAENPIVDFNDDGLFNFFDVSAFIGYYNTGCP